MEINQFIREEDKKRVLVTKGVEVSAYFTGSLDGTGLHKQLHLTVYMDTGEEVKLMVPVAYRNEPKEDSGE